MIYFNYIYNQLCILLNQMITMIFIKYYEITTHFDNNIIYII